MNGGNAGGGGGGVCGRPTSEVAHVPIQALRGALGNDNERIRSQERESHKCQARTHRPSNVLPLATKCHGAAPLMVAV